MKVNKKFVVIGVAVGLTISLIVLGEMLTQQPAFQYVPLIDRWAKATQAELINCDCRSTQEGCHPWKVLNLIFSYDAGRAIRDEIRDSYLSRWPQFDTLCGKANSTFGSPSQDKILTLFVMGNPHSSLAEKVYAESREHGDMVFLDTDEGWNRGRTFEAFRYFHRNFNFEILGKVDDDSFIHGPNLLKILMDTENKVGRNANWLFGMGCFDRNMRFVCGEGFWMSRGTAKFFGESDSIKRYEIGAEDFQTTLAYKNGVQIGELQNFHEVLIPGGKEFIDISGAKSGAATIQRAFSMEDNVLVHQVKTADGWKHCRDFFFPSNTFLDLGVLGMSALYVVRGVNISDGSFPVMKMMLARIGIPVPDERVVIATNGETLSDRCSIGKIKTEWDTNADMSKACSSSLTTEGFALFAHRHTHTRLLIEIAHTKTLNKPVIVLDSRLDIDRTFVERVEEALNEMPKDSWDILCLAGCESDQGTEEGLGRVVQSNTKGFSLAYVVNGWKSAEKMIHTLDVLDITKNMDDEFESSNDWHAFTLSSPVACLPDPSVGKCPTLRKSMLTTYLETKQN